MWGCVCVGIALVGTCACACRHYKTHAHVFLGKAIFIVCYALIDTNCAHGGT